MDRAKALLTLTMALLNVVIALVVLVFALRLVFGLEDVALRRGLLTAGLCLVAAIWLLTQVYLERSVTWLLNIRELSPLPFGFGTLFGLRSVGYLIGGWLPVLGPAAFYLAFSRSSGALGLAVTTMSMLLAVAIQGQIVSIVMRERDRLVEGLLGSAVVLGAMSVFYIGLYWGLSFRTGDLNVGDAARWLSDPVLVRTAAFTPAGLLAAILNDSESTWRNGARFLGLCLYAVVIGICDRKLLRGLQFGSPSGAPQVKHPTLPLSAFLRRLRALSPSGVLTLVELESGARSRAIRWSMLIALAFFGYLVVAIENPVLVVIGSLALASANLTGYRGETTLPTCRIWSESFALPVTPLRALRAMARAPFLVEAWFAGAAFAACLFHFGWFGWPYVGYLILHCLAATFFADAAWAWFDARWQTPAEAEKAKEADTRTGKGLARRLLGVHLLVRLLPNLYLFLFLDDTPSPLALSAAVAMYAALAVSAGMAFRASTRRLIDSRGLGGLLGQGDLEASARSAFIGAPSRSV